MDLVKKRYGEEQVDQGLNFVQPYLATHSEGMEVDFLV